MHELEHESAISVLKEIAAKHKLKGYAFSAISTAISCIEMCDSIVSCKECRYWKKDVAGCTKFVGRCALSDYMIGENGYCLYGAKENR